MKFWFSLSPRHNVTRVTQDCYYSKSGKNYHMMERTHVPRRSGFHPWPIEAIEKITRLSEILNASVSGEAILKLRAREEHYLAIFAWYAWKCVAEHGMNEPPFDRNSRNLQFRFYLISTRYVGSTLGFGSSPTDLPIDDFSQLFTHMRCILPQNSFLFQNIKLCELSLYDSLKK